MNKDYNGTSDYIDANVDNEIKQDWKAERIDAYVKLEKEIAIITHELNIDPELNRLIKQQVALCEMIEVAKAPHFKSIEVAQQQQAGIKLELAEKWDCLPFKEYACDAGIATLRTTRSLHIRSKEKLVAFLELNKKLTEFIKNFEITKLRKIKDAGLLGDEIATYDEKKNVAIKIAEARQ